MTTEALEKRVAEDGIIAFRCKEAFYGVYMAGREDKFAERVKIHSEGETFTLYNDTSIGAFGDVFYRMNDAKGMFFEGMITMGSIVRAIKNGALEIIEDYKRPKVTVYSLEEVLPVKTL